MSHIQIDQARSATDRRSYHAGHCTGQSFFKRRKSCAATYALSLRSGLRRFGELRRAGLLIDHDSLAQKRASTVRRQTFGPHHSGEQSLVCQILFNGPQRLLAGQKHGPHARRGIVGRKETRLLKFYLQYAVALVQFGRSRKITKRKEKAG
jgi:hypothetical protein